MAAPVRSCGESVERLPGAIRFAGAGAGAVLNVAAGAALLATLAALLLLLTAVHAFVMTTGLVLLTLAGGTRARLLALLALRLLLRIALRRHVLLRAVLLHVLLCHGRAPNLDGVCRKLQWRCRRKMRRGRC